MCQKSQDKFLATDRTSSLQKSAKKDINRARSQRVLKDSSNRNNADRTPRKLVREM